MQSLLFNINLSVDRFQPYLIWSRICLMTHVWRACTIAMVVSAGVATATPAAAQSPAAAPANLVIGGDVTQTLTLQPAELKSMPRTTVTVT